MVQFDVKRVSKGSESFMVSFDFAKTPITQVADYIIIAASKKDTSDIHFDPREDCLMVRFRIDGDLQDYTAVPKAYEKNLITRLKLLANMNITETRLPQDGAIKGTFGGQYLDMRVSCLPISEGEKVVIRILDYTRSLQGIDSLGFNARNLEKLKRMIRVPNGIILTTGATGSGKSTTTYSILQVLNTPETNIITVEDPIEMNIKGINQVQVNAEIGMTFAAALRSILRQDPNVILIGEIRDSETAQIAVRASITGHLVISTIHTNNSLSTIERLLDMDVERYLLSSALTGIISQRLAKQLCEHCRYQRETTPYEKKVFKKFMGKDVNMVWAANEEGCENCRKGYRGRIAIQEVLELDDDIRAAISNEHLEKEDLAKMVYTNKTITMLQDALGKALDGITSFEEVYRVIEIESEDSDHYEGIDNSEKEKNTSNEQIANTELPTTLPITEETKPIQNEQKESPVVAETTNELAPLNEIPTEKNISNQIASTETAPLTQPVQLPNLINTSNNKTTENQTKTETDNAQLSVLDLISNQTEENKNEVSTEYKEQENESIETFFAKLENISSNNEKMDGQTEPSTEIQTIPIPNTSPPTEIQTIPNTSPPTEIETEPLTKKTDSIELTEAKEKKVQLPEVSKLEKLNTIIENTEPKNVTQTTNIEIKGLAGINAEPLVPSLNSDNK